MVDFPIGGGVSGHLLGGLLAALILGPWEAFIALSVVLALQTILLGDGGIATLGANVFNMGIVGVLGGYAYFIFLQRGEADGTANQRRPLMNAFMATWVSVIATAFSVSLETMFVGTQSAANFLPVMFSTHIFIGLIEGIATVGILRYLRHRRYPLAVYGEPLTETKE